ncbi:MAG: PEGA domain-containing protein [Patescibacteria group bacterium]|nr:PEGA domain-containing protein [Patescibacteria group bacterium]
MKRFVSWGLILRGLLILIIGLAGGCSKAPLPTELNTEVKKPIVGRLVVYASDEKGNPVDSAEVYLNGKFIGRTPVSTDSVVLGIHVLRVQKEGFRVFRETVVIQDTHRVFVEALLQLLPKNEGELLITVDQDSPTVTVKDSNHNLISKQQTRELVLTLSPGGYFIKVSA